VLNCYEEYLLGANETGLCAVDPVPDSAGVQILEDIFHHGLELPNRDEEVRDLEHVQMISTVSANASHASSLMDIVLGGFGYCINNLTNPDRENVTAEIFSNIAPLTYGFEESDGLNYGKGVLLRPRIVMNSGLNSRYTRLRENLDALVERATMDHSDDDSLDYEDLFGSPTLD